MIAAAGLSDIGCKRSANEDRILVELEEHLFVVADGMGGQRCGARAAELATFALDEYFHSWSSTLRNPGELNAELQPTQEIMAAAIRLANERVFQESVSSSECTGMGCTVSAVNVNGNMATVGSVGDSRVYLFRDGELLQLTRDDSVLAQLLASGAIRPEEMSTHPMRNVLTQSVGTKDDIDIQIIEFAMASNDRLLLSSDGLHGVVDNTVIEGILASNHDPDATVHQLIAAARERGAPDNVSCVVVNYTV
jgi:protein phosphatase